MVVVNNADRLDAERMGCVNLKLASTLKPSMHSKILIGDRPPVDPSSAGTVQPFGSLT